jgi:HK97 family phage major capsid protein
VPAPYRFGLQAALPGKPLATSSTVVRYGRYSSLEGDVAVQAGEGTAKSPLTPVFALQNQDTITLAGVITASEQALQDRAELESTINNVLLRRLQVLLDDVLVDGSATPTWAGFESLATAAATSSYANLADAISEGVSAMQEAGFSPSIVCMPPAAFLEMVTATATGGEYLSGAYLNSLPESVRGLRIALSSNVAAGKALLIDPGVCEWYVAQDVDFKVGTVDDQFSKNLVTLRAELRIVPVFRAVGGARVVTPA